jgi:hypothetical protein
LSEGRPGGERSKDSECQNPQHQYSPP